MHGQDWHGLELVGVWQVPGPGPGSALAGEARVEDGRALLRLRRRRRCRRAGDGALVGRRQEGEKKMVLGAVASGTIFSCPAQVGAGRVSLKRACFYSLLRLMNLRLK